MLGQNQLTFLQSRLESWRQDLANRIEETAHFGKDYAMQDSVKELSVYDNHPGDMGTEEFERGKDLALNEHAERELQQVEEALERMKEGHYGVCEVCHEEIPYERLEAVPTTKRCIKHASEKAVSHKRPVEEDILAPPFGEFEYDEKDATFFDAEDAWQRVAAYGTSETPSDFIGQHYSSYNDMYIESDEPVGYVEELEGFIITDMEGNHIDVNEYHNKYERFLDDNNVTSIFGDTGIMGVDYLGEDTEDEL